jgi:hypothetical protein
LQRKIGRRVGALLLAALTAAACSTRVTSSPPVAISATPIAQPARVAVMDFALPDSVRLDQGVASRLQRLAGGADTGALQAQTAADVQDAVTETLVAAIDKMGLNAVALGPGEAALPGDAVVSGRITRIDQGNRTRRLAIGFGAGKSEVDASAQLALVTPTGPMVVQTYTASSNSGHKPGLAVGAASSAAQSTLAPAALTAVTGLHAEQTRTGVAGEGQRLAQHLATSLGTYFAGAGWIPPSAVPQAPLR